MTSEVFFRELLQLRECTGSKSIACRKMSTVPELMQVDSKMRLNLEDNKNTVSMKVSHLCSL